MSELLGCFLLAASEDALRSGRVRTCEGVQRMKRGFDRANVYQTRFVVWMNHLWILLGLEPDEQPEYDSDEVPQ